MPNITTSRIQHNQAVPRRLTRLKSMTTRIGQTLCSLIISGLLTTPALGYERPLTFETSRSHGMGGASVAIADDQQALFCNPAGLGMRTTSAFSVLSATGDRSEDYDTVSDHIDRLSDADTAASRAANFITKLFEGKLAYVGDTTAMREELAAAAERKRELPRGEIDRDERRRRDVERHRRRVGDREAVADHEAEARRAAIACLRREDRRAAVGRELDRAVRGIEGGGQRLAGRQHLLHVGGKPAFWNSQTDLIHGIPE